MKQSFLAVFPVLLALGTPLQADPVVGLGLTVTFGSGAQPEAGIGLRVFSDDEEKAFAGSLGVDYLFASQRLRPSVGVAYLGSGAYLGADLGYNFGTSGFDVGVGVGAVNTRAPAAAPTPPTSPVVTSVPGGAG